MINDNNNNTRNDAQMSARRSASNNGMLIISYLVYTSLVYMINDVYKLPIFIIV